MINDLPRYIVTCLIATIIIELLFSLIIKINNKKDILNIILVNILTNPIVVTLPFVLNVYISLTARNISLFILEILTVIVEGYIYKKVLISKKNPYILSLYLNSASYFLGLILGHFIF